MDAKMNNEFRLHVQKSLKKNIRFDGRKLDQCRPITVEYGISKNAEGSARVKIGNTEVLAGVKMSIESPYPDVPDQGNLMVNAELLPMSSPDFAAACFRPRSFAAADDLASLRSGSSSCRSVRF